LDPGSGIRDPGSGIRDPGWVKIRIRDPGSGINIPDPQHWTTAKAFCSSFVACKRRSCLHNIAHNLTYILPVLRSRGAEIKLPSGAEITVLTAAPASFYLPQTRRNFL
jgi:hypothetical protein